MARSANLKRIASLAVIWSVIAATARAQAPADKIDINLSQKNPFLVDLNEPVKFAAIQPKHIEEYVSIIQRQLEERIVVIGRQKTPTFDNTFAAFDDALTILNNGRDVLNTLEKLSPDSLIKEYSSAGKSTLDSLATVLFSDPGIAQQMNSYQEMSAYEGLNGPRKILADFLVGSLNWGTSDEYEALISRNRKLEKMFTESIDSEQSVVVLDEADVDGLPAPFKKRFYKAPSQYEIPRIRSTRQIVMANAKSEETRKAFFKGSEEVTRRNLEILRELVENRHKMAQAEGYRSYAEMFTGRTMAGSPDVIWEFIYDVLEDTRDIATRNLEKLKQVRNLETGIQSYEPIRPWNIFYYSMLYNRANFQVNRLALNPYLQLENCLDGMFELYQQLLGLTFKKVEDASVWHNDVEMYHVFEGDPLKAVFYLDLYSRPKKKISGGMQLSIRSGSESENGYQVPVSVLVTNYLKPTASEASLLSYPELKTLFHEFGHVMQHSSYDGAFTYLSNPPRDFNEAMSQIFENWLEDYDIISAFARHYKTGEILPKNLFDTYLKSLDTLAGIRTHRSLGLAIYDMYLHDKFEPDNPSFLDHIWEKVDQHTVTPMSYEGFYPQAHNHFFFNIPVYLYTYTWSDVYAKDMFSVFKKNGLKDRATGQKYLELILSNGSQRNMTEALKAFLGRPSNNKAFVKSLDLN